MNYLRSQSDLSRERLERWAAMDQIIVNPGDSVNLAAVAREILALRARVVELKRMIQKINGITILNAEDPE